jgi:serine phosphatase RsbU (regulator of sigma subunit)
VLLRDRVPGSPLGVDDPDPAGGDNDLREKQIAARIQASILPGQVDIEGLEIAAGMLPTEMVGGDYYDIIPVKDGCWIAIGDVAGHGLAAGLIMLMIQSTLHGLVKLSPDAHPRELVSALNSVLFENVRRRMKRREHVTFCLVRYWPDGRIVFAGAHEDILISRARGEVEALTPTGTWLGAIEDVSKFTIDKAAQLQPGDVMLLYTDGVIEARNASGVEFGYETLKRVFKELSQSNPTAIRNGIVDAVRAWTPNIDDDLTLVAIRCQGVYWPETDTDEGQ